MTSRIEIGDATITRADLLQAVVTRDMMTVKEINGCAINSMFNAGTMLNPNIIAELTDLLRDLAEETLVAGGETGLFASTVELILKWWHRIGASSNSAGSSEDHTHSSEPCVVEDLRDGLAEIHVAVETVMASGGGRNGRVMNEILARIWTVVNRAHPLPQPPHSVPIGAGGAGPAE